jgi:hypothetical protein
VRVAIIGAGIAGLACARALAGAGHAPSLFDKGRGAGGRLSTKRLTHDGAEHRIDLGAQYMTVRDPRFAAALAALGDAVVPWSPRLPGGERPQGWFAGAPSMSALPRALAAGLDVRTGATVAPPARDGDGWALADTDGTPLGHFDALVVATPAEQAVPLLAAVPALAAAAGAARTAPCWSAAIWTDADPAFDAARDPSPEIGWLARHASRPGRSDAPVWVVHASAGWSRANLERDAGSVAGELAALAAPLLGGQAHHAVAHRWRYALVESAAAPAWDASARVGACGDWCAGPRVELAWASGDALGRAIAG